MNSSITQAIPELGAMRDRSVIPGVRLEAHQNGKIGVLLCDDHAVLRAGLCALLLVEHDMAVLGQASSGEEAVELAARLKPAVVVMDIGLPGIDGLEASRRIGAQTPECRLLMLTMHREVHYLLSALKAGASGYVLKSDLDTELIEAIRRVHQGQTFVYSADTRNLFKAHLERGGSLEGPKRLSDMETQVLKRTAQGYTSKEIGEQLNISSSTVDTYRMRIMQKLDLNHRAELVSWAKEYGLL